MRFFRTLLTDDRPFATDLANEPTRVETVDLFGPAAWSTPSASHAQATAAAPATAAVGSPSLDAGTPAHAAAAAWPTGLEFKHSVPGTPTPVDRTVELGKVQAPDAPATPKVEPAVEPAVVPSAVVAPADAAPPSTAGHSSETPAVHAVDAGDAVVAATVSTIVAEAAASSTASVDTTAPGTHAANGVEPIHAVETVATPSAVTDGVVPSVPSSAVGAFVVLDDGHATSGPAVPQAVLVPWWITAGGATASVEGKHASGVETVATPDVAPVPAGADGADHGADHGMFPVNPPASTSTPDALDTVGAGDSAVGGTSGDVLAAQAVDSTKVLPIAVDATPVAGSMAHAVVGTVIIDAGDAAGPASTDLVAGCSPSSPESWIPEVPVIFEIPVDASEVKTVAGPEVAPEVTTFPERADGADRWENHSMFSVNPPDDGKAPATVSEVTTPVTSAPPEPTPASGLGASEQALKDFLDSWRCDQPVEPEYLRHAPRPEVTMPSRPGGGTETTVVPSFTAEAFDSTIHQGITAEVYDSTTHQGITAASMPLVIAEQYAVL